MNNPAALYYIRECIVIIFKHKKKILLSLLGAIVVLLIVMAWLPQSYLASATVMVKFGREFILPSEIGNTKTPILNQESIIQTEAEIIKSRDICHRVVKALGPTVMYPKIAKNRLTPLAENEAAAGLFLSRVTARAIKGTNLIDVTFEHENRQLAAKALNLLLEYFKERHLEIFSDPKSSFIEQQAKTYGDRLREAQNALAQYKQTHGLFAIDDQRSVTIRQLEQLDETINTEHRRLREIQAQSLTMTMTTSPVQTADSVMNQLQSQLMTLEQKEQQVSDKYSEASNFVLDIRRDMRFVKHQIEARAKDLRSTEATRMRGQIEPISARISELNQYRDTLQRRLHMLDQKSAGMQNLKREVAINEDNYNTYTRKLEEANISAELDRKKMTNIMIVENAVASSVPNPAKQAKKIAVYLTLCAVVALGTGFACELVPQKVTTPERLEKILGLPVLAAVPAAKA